METEDWSVSILSSNTVDCDDPYTLYDIEVTSPTSTKLVKRRFRQFWDLHLYLVTIDKSLPFPPKVLNKMNPKVIQDRILHLQLYLRHLLTRPELFGSFRVKLFLGLNESMEGKTCIITGSNSGIGLETARALAYTGMHVIMACRSEERTRPIIESLKEETKNSNIEFIYLNLASLISVRNFVDYFKAKGRPLHLLVNNAGCLAELCVTVDGFETTFGVNYLGHFLLTLLLLKHMGKSSRIIFVCDEFKKMRPILNEKVREEVTIPGVFEAYELSKQAIFYFSKELTQRLGSSGISVFCAFPEGCATNLFRTLPDFMDWIVKKFVKSPEEGALPVIYCSISEELDSRSGISISSNLQEKTHDVLNTEECTTLWKLSHNWISEIFRENNLDIEIKIGLNKQDLVTFKSNPKQQLDIFEVKPKQYPDIFEVKPKQYPDIFEVKPKQYPDIFDVKPKQYPDIFDVKPKQYLDIFEVNPKPSQPRSKSNIESDSEGYGEYGQKIFY